jgi:hypothetical protein
MAGKLYLENGSLRVGIDENRGGSIFHISKKGKTFNFLDDFDMGRCLQQSYYGRDDGSFWSKRPWCWNPVQAGSWSGKSSKLIYSNITGNIMRSSCIPRNWGGEQLLNNVQMDTSIELLNDCVHTRFSMRYTGSVHYNKKEVNPLKHQEVPAMFVNRTLYRLHLYEGTKPWTRDIISVKSPVILTQGQRNDYFDIKENWVAYENPTTKEAIGLYSPVANRVTAYRVGKNDIIPSRGDSSYCAPIISKALIPNTVFSYDMYVALGTVNDIRNIFYRINRK